MEVKILLDVEQVKYAQVGVDLDTDKIGRVVQRHGPASGTHRYGELVVRQLRKVGVHAWNGVTLRNGPIELELNVRTIQRQVGVGSYQSSFVSACFQAVKIDAWHRKSGRFGGCEHGQDEVHVVDGKSYRAVFGGACYQLPVGILGHGFVGPIEARKGLNVDTGNNQCVCWGNHLNAGQVEPDAIQGALLEGESTLQTHDTGHIRGGQAHGGLDQFGIEAQNDGRTARVHRDPRYSPPLGEVKHCSGLVALVDGYANVIEIELDEITKSNKANLIRRSL